MNTELSPKYLKEICGEAEAEFCLYVRNTDNTRKIIVVRDYGYKIDHEEIQINPFKTREERNAEILRLYKEEGISQIFLGNLFNISQPSVSVIVNAK